MELAFTVIFSFITIILGMILIVSNINKNKKIYLIDWAIFIYVLLYGIGFPLVYFSTKAGINTSNYANYIIRFSITDIIYYYLLVISLMIFTKLGFHLKLSKRNIKRKHSKIINVSLLNERDERFLRKQVKFAWVMLLISFVSYYVYAMAYGGFSGLLSYTISIRSGTISISNRFSFLEKFGQFSNISAYVFFALAIDKTIMRKRKKSVYVGLLLSTIFSLYFLYSRGGRGSMVFFILILILTVAYYNSKKLSVFFFKILKKVVWLPVVFILMDILWSRTTESSILSLFVSSISYPFAALIVNLKNGTHRFFLDLIQTPFYFLPSSIWSSLFKFTTADDETTYLISGGYKGENVGGSTITGSTPNDLLTFTYIQAGIIGVIIIGILFGLLLKYFHSKILNLKYNGLKSMLYSYFIVRFVITLILYGDTSHIIITNWGFIMYFSIFHVYKKIRIKKKHNYKNYCRETSTKQLE